MVDVIKRSRGRPKKNPAGQDIHIRCDREIVKDIQEHGISLQFIFDLGVSFMYPEELEKNLTRVSQDLKLLELVKKSRTKVKEVC